MSIDLEKGLAISPDFKVALPPSNSVNKGLAPSNELEDGLALSELGCSLISVHPCMSFIGGFGKICLGTIQTTGALGISIISYMVSYCNGNEIYKKSRPHILHGLGNIAAGALESVPCIGTLIACCRFRKISKENLTDFEKFNFFPYQKQSQMLSQ